MIGTICYYRDDYTEEEWDYIYDLIVEQYKTYGRSAIFIREKVD